MNNLRIQSKYHSFAQFNFQFIWYGFVVLTANIKIHPESTLKIKFNLKKKNNLMNMKSIHFLLQK